jgi:hypothetical protein
MGSVVVDERIVCTSGREALITNRSGIAQGVTRGRDQDDLRRHIVLNWSQRRAEWPAE